MEGLSPGGVMARTILDLMQAMVRGQAYFMSPEVKDISQLIGEVRGDIPSFVVGNSSQRTGYSTKFATRLDYVDAALPGSVIKVTLSFTTTKPGYITKGLFRSSLHALSYCLGVFRIPPYPLLITCPYLVAFSVAAPAPPAAIAPVDGWSAKPTTIDIHANLATAITPFTHLIRLTLMPIAVVTDTAMIVTDITRDTNTINSIPRMMSPTFGVISEFIRLDSALRTRRMPYPASSSTALSLTTRESLVNLPPDSVS